MQYKLIEKAKPLHTHGLFGSLASAERFLAEMVPEYIHRSYYMDKTLTPESFAIVHSCYSGTCGALDCHDCRPDNFKDGVWIEHQRD